MTRKGGQGPWIFDASIDIFKWISLFAANSHFDLWKESSQSYGQDHELLGKTLKKRVIEFIFRTCNFTKNDFKWLTLLKKITLRYFSRNLFHSFRGCVLQNHVNNKINN